MLKLSRMLLLYLLLLIPSLFTPHKYLNDSLIYKNNIVYAQDDEKTDKHEVRFAFVEYYSITSTKGLPDSVVKLLPEKQYVTSDDEIQLPKYDFVDGYEFVEWDKASYSDGTILYVGIWKNTNTKAINHVGNPGYAGRVYAWGKGDYSGGIPGNAVPYFEVENVEAYCVRVDIPYFVGTIPTSFWDVSYGYGDGSQMPNRVAEIIGIGKIRGVSHAEIQAAVWVELGGANKYSSSAYSNPNHSIYDNDGSFVCSGRVYESYRDPNTGNNFQDLGTASCRIVETKGKLNVKKTAANSIYNYMSLYPNNYSLIDAQYGVYKDANCTNLISTLTIGKDGISNTIEVNAGTYYIKETKSSLGFRLDSKVYECKVSANNTTTITSIEEPKSGKAKLIKKANDNFFLNEYTSYYSLADAQYSIYTDEKCTNKIATLTTKNDGSTDEIQLPEATYYLKETKASKGFKLDNTIYPIVIKDNKTATIQSIEVPYFASLKLNKKAKYTDYDFINNLKTNYNLKDAIYGLYADENCKSLISKINTNSDGTSKVISIPVGNFYLKEIKASQGFKVDKTIYPIKVKDNEFIEIESIEDPIDDPTLITLYKQNIKDSQNTKYLDEVNFIVKYYDILDDNINNIEPLYKWIFKASINENEVAQICLNKNHFVEGDELLLDEDDNLKIPLGTFTIEELYAPQTYARDENVYIGQIINEDGNKKIIFNDGEYMSRDVVLFSTVDNKNQPFRLRQLEKQIILKTTATFLESGTDHYVADGIAHIEDVVEYDFLKENHEYLLKAKLINKKDEIVLTENEVTFKTEKSTGKASIILEFNLDEYDDSDFVVYEYLYDKDKPEELLAKHEDLNNEFQTVHVDKLYRADMILYKIGGTKGVKLNGAIFEINTSRTKKDGTLEEKNLGKFMSGGIFVEKDYPFEFKLSMDKKMQVVIDTISSRKHNTFNSEYVSVLGLEEGIYYGQVNDEEVKEYLVEKGMIILKDQKEDTTITYKELVAPAGYHLEKEEYVVNVGNDTSLTKIENYRMNRAIIIPKTGIDKGA